jgi:hypothetical protein
MSLLQRLTTQYIDIEDRVRLSGEDVHGAVQVLWLTQRLLDRLVPALCKQLTPDRGMHEELLSSFRQQAATAQLAAQEPVRAAEDSTACLITRVDLAGTEAGLQLAFHTRDKEAAHIIMPELAQRQWLAILREQSRVAGWRESAWPEWTDPAPATPASTHWH